MNKDIFLKNFGHITDTPNGIQKLRELIFRLSVRGKIVNQDLSDESVELLYKKLVKSKKKNNSISENHAVLDGPYKIPKSWMWVRLGDIVDFNIGKTPSTQKSVYWDDRGFPWVSIRDMPNSGHVSITRKHISQKAIKEVFRSEPIPKGTLLMSFKLSIGKVAFLDMDAFHNEAIISIMPGIPELNNYLHHCFQGLDLMTNKTTKNAIKGKTLNKASISRLLIPLPPLAEQQRIVTKIDELMKLCDDLEKKLVECQSCKEKLSESVIYHTLEG